MTTTPVPTIPGPSGSPAAGTSTVDRFLVAVASGNGLPPELYAAGAELDAVVPNWRLGASGGGAISSVYGSWFAHPGAFDELSRRSTATGEVVEYTLSWVEDGVAHAARHVHVLDLDDAGRIVRDHVWCGGRWPEPLLAQIEAARHAL
ncbi:MAG: hypothetical protein ACT4PW_13665 [Acidimicrobiia bacterium]